MPAPIAGIVTDCDPIPLPDATASVIVCSEVMEHVEAPARFLAELVRVGKPGAQYVMSVPAAASEELMKVLAPPSYFEPPGHLRIFDRGEFEGLIRSAGLEIERSEGLGYYWSIWWALRMASGTSHCPDSATTPPPILVGWEETWRTRSATQLGPRVIEVLDRLIPKSILVVARKHVAISKPPYLDPRPHPRPLIDRSEHRAARSVDPRADPTPLPRRLPPPI